MSSRFIYISFFLMAEKYSVVCIYKLKQSLKNTCDPDFFKLHIHEDKETQILIACIFLLLVVCAI